MEKKDVNTMLNKSSNQASLMKSRNNLDPRSSRILSNNTAFDKETNGSRNSNNTPKIIFRDDVDVPKKVNFMSDLFAPLKQTKWISEVEFHTIWEDNKLKEIHRVNNLESYTEESRDINKHDFDNDDFE